MYSIRYVIGFKVPFVFSGLIRGLLEVLACLVVGGVAWFPNAPAVVPTWPT